jgi:hypothetical protein
MRGSHFMPKVAVTFACGLYDRMNARLCPVNDGFSEKLPPDCHRVSLSRVLLEHPQTGI